MINANELRIGNWIFNGNDHPIEVGYHEIRYAALHPGTQNNYSPILLTPKILKKCGFEKADKHHIALKQDMFSISFDGETFCIFDEEFGVGSGVIVSSGISKYMHQLQNLIFALTGQELIIQL